jgi:hypothetical protein
VEFLETDPVRVGEEDGDVIAGVAYEKVAYEIFAFGLYEFYYPLDQFLAGHDMPADTTDVSFDNG